MPWTRTRSEPSGTRIIFCTTAAVPTSYRSSQPGCSTLVVLRGHEGDHPVARDDFVHQPDRPFLADREREHGVGEDDRVLQREDRKRRRELELVDVDLLVEEVRHRPLLIWIVTRSGTVGFFASGSTIVSTPRLYVAFEPLTSTSSPRATCRVKRP